VSVTDQPIAAEISLYLLTAVNGTIRPSAECSTGVNARGYFQCEHLPAGTYFLLATPHQSLSDKDFSSKTSLEPGTPDKATAVRPQVSIPPIIVFPLLNSGLQNLIHLREGGHQSIEIQIPSDPMCRLKARPALGFATGQVQLFAEGEGFSVRLNVQEATDPEDGDYLWDGIPPGTYKIIEDWSEEQDNDRHYAVKAVSIDPSAPWEVALADARRYHVAGRIEYEGKSHGSMARILLNPTAEDGLGRYATTVQKDGSFAFKDVAEGSYRVLISPNTAAKIEQVSIAGKELSDPVIFVGAGNSIRSLVISIVPAGGSVSGILQLDGSEVKPGLVIQSLDSQTATAVPVQTGGFFQVTSLAPGSYRISGWADISRVPYDTPSFLAPYKDQAVDVEINESSPVMGIELRCIHAEL
jgi:hypothetical protein